jgi:DNA-binding MarR family transcriptional regulator
MTDHPTNGLDEVVHQRHRLGILTIAAEAKRAEFGYLREALDLTPGNLSRHLTVLEGAGLVDVEKGYEGRRPRTWVRITRQGRTALAAELDVLAALVRQHAVVARRASPARGGAGSPADGDAGGSAEAAPAAGAAAEQTNAPSASHGVPAGGDENHVGGDQPPADGDNPPADGDLLRLAAEE